MALRDYITEEVTIEEASEDGKKWTIKVDVPSMRSKYPIGPLWKDYVDGERIHKGDKVNIKMVRGKLKKAGSYEDADFGYFWELAEWDTDAPPQSVANGQVVSTPAPQGDNLSGIKWGASLNQAASLLSHNIAGPDEALALEDRVYEVASMFFRLNNLGPPQAEPAPERHDPRDGPETPIGKELERKPPVGSLAKLKQVNQARSDETIDVHVLENYVANNYAERDLRGLDDTELDQVIEAIIAGQVAPPATPPYDYNEELPF